MISDQYHDFYWKLFAGIRMNQKCHPGLFTEIRTTLSQFPESNSLELFGRELIPKIVPKMITPKLNFRLGQSYWSFAFINLISSVETSAEIQEPKKKSVPQSQIVEKDIRTTVSTWGRNTPLRSKNFVVGRFNDKTTTVTTADSGCFGPPYLHPLALGIHHTWTQSLLLSRQFSLWFLDLSEESLSCDRFLIPVV